MDRITEQESAATQDQSVVNEGARSSGAKAVGVVSAVFRWPKGTSRRLYNWTTSWSRTRQAHYALFTVAFVESSVFPIPPDVLLLPMVASRRAMWFRYALICSIGSVLGALLGYLIGWAFYESVGKGVVNAYDLHRSMELIGERYSQNAFLTVFTAAFTPIPLKVITIGAGLFEVPISALVAGSIVGRAGRFYMVAGLLRLFGEGISGFMEKHFDRLCLVFAAMLIGGFIALKYL